MPPPRPFGMVHSAVPRHVGAVLGQLDEGRHLIQDAGRVWQLLLRLYLRLSLRAQLVLDALAELSVPAPVDGPQDLAEARVVMRCYRGVKLVTVHPVRWHDTRSYGRTAGSRRARQGHAICRHHAPDTAH